MTTPKNPPPPNLITPEDLETIYSNLARIAHSPADFVIEFAHLLPNEKQANVQARIVLSPLSTKMLLRALADNLARYEASFGEINMPKSSLADQLFRPQQPPGSPTEED